MLCKTKRITCAYVSWFNASMYCQRTVENTPKIWPAPTRTTKMGGKCPNHWWWWLCVAQQPSIGPWSPVLHNSRHAVFYGERSLLAQPGSPGHRIYIPLETGWPTYTPRQWAAWDLGGRHFPQPLTVSPWRWYQRSRFIKPASYATFRVLF